MRVTPHNWRRELHEQTATLLDGLGGDPDEVARRLRAAGVQGVPRDPSACAIAQYLSAVVSADHRVDGVAVLSARVVLTPTGRLRRPVVVKLPVPLRTFVAGFDRDRYPDLVRRPADKRTKEGTVLQGSS